MKSVHAQDVLAGAALAVLALLAGFMCFRAVPPENHDFIVYILGTISGALALGGGQRAVRGLQAMTGTSDAGAPNGPQA